MSMTRKEFLGTVLTGAAALALVSACGDDDSPADAAAGNPDAATGPDAAPPSCTDNGAASSGSQISANHGHTLVVPAADVAATAMDRTYSIKGSSPHDHMVTITAAQFGMLKANTGGFTITSTVGSTHTHTVTVVCA